ncbi:MAG: hypothetical protein K6E83_12435 [Clostridium sp.]|nr:hypothetical protein [Clostridium sp.]
MKKLITILLIIALLPVTALADESGIIGFWANCGMNEDNTPSMIIYYFSEDHICYYMLKSFSSFYGYVSRADTGIWELQEDGTVKTVVRNARNFWEFSDSFDYAINIRSGDRYMKVIESDMQTR